MSRVAGLKSNPTHHRFQASFVAPPVRWFGCSLPSPCLAAAAAATIPRPPLPLLPPSLVLGAFKRSGWHVCNGRLSLLQSMSVTVNECLLLLPSADKPVSLLSSSLKESKMVNASTSTVLRNECLSALPLALFLCPRLSSSILLSSAHGCPPHLLTACLSVPVSPLIDPV